MKGSFPGACRVTDTLQNATADSGHVRPGASYCVSTIRLNLETVFGPIPFTLNKSSQELIDLLPPLDLQMRAASTGPRPGNRTSDSGGAVEKKTNGSSRKREGSLSLTDAVFSAGKSFVRGTFCRTAADGVGGGGRQPEPWIDSSILGNAIKQNISHAPVIRRTYFLHPPRGPGSIKYSPGQSVHDRSRGH